MVKLNGICKNLDYEYYCDKQEKIWEKLESYYEIYGLNLELCDCFRELQYIKPYINNITTDNINIIINGLNSNETLSKIIDIILDNYDFPGNINFGTYYTEEKRLDSYYRFIDITPNYKKKLLYFKKIYDILEENIKSDIDNYDYYANKNSIWSWFYWTIIDPVRYAWRSIGNLSNLTLRKCLRKLNDFYSYNIDGSSAKSKRYLENIENAVTISKLIKDEYLIELNNQGITFERKVELIKTIESKYQEIYRLLRLKNSMHQD